jgi:hypothetical protein
LIYDKIRGGRVLFSGEKKEEEEEEEIREGKRGLTSYNLNITNGFTDEY